MSLRPSLKRRKLSRTHERQFTPPTTLSTSAPRKDGPPEDSGRSTDETSYRGSRPSKTKDISKTSQTTLLTTETGQSNSHKIPEAENEVNVARVSGRQRKAPRRYSNEMVPEDTIVVGVSHSTQAKGKSKPAISVSASQVHSTIVTSAPASLASTRFHSLKYASPETPKSLSGGRSREKVMSSRKSLTQAKEHSGNVKLAKKPSTTGSVGANTVPRGKLKKIQKSATPTKGQRGHFLEEETGLDLGEDDEPEDELSVEKLSAAFPIQDSDGRSMLERSMKEPHSALKAPKELPIQISASSAVMKLIKSIVQNKLSGRRAIPLIGMDDEYLKVYHLLEQTVLAGEGNSMLIIGDRGTGKTALVNKILLQLEKTDRDSFHVIRLNGFIHTDDKLALREIWRQLGKEMELEDEAQTKNYADTLSTLLALLSHPAELSENESNLVAKSVLFIMDEFDLFTTHSRQTLLYNLFDICQSRKAPIAVLGLTTRIDVAESLEKRVKSRFSHRFVHLSLPKTFGVFQSICKAAIQLQSTEMTFDERTHLAKIGSNPRTHSKTTSHEEPLKSWNQSVETLFQTKSFEHNLERIYYTSKSIPVALTSFLLPILNIDLNDPHFHPDNFNAENSLQAPDSKLHILASLPTLAIALLIAAARLDIILESDLCNFNMAYEEYSSLATKAKVQASAGRVPGVGIGGRIWGREVAKGAWEQLLDTELLIPATTNGSVADMVRCDVALEEIETSVPGLEKGMVKWCREI